MTVWETNLRVRDSSKFWSGQILVFYILSLWILLTECPHWDNKLTSDSLTQLCGFSGLYDIFFQTLSTNKAILYKTTNYAT